jgi:hypothetical protein
MAARRARAPVVIETPPPTVRGAPLLERRGHARPPATLLRRAPHDRGDAGPRRLEPLRLGLAQPSSGRSVRLLDRRRARREAAALPQGAFVLPGRYEVRLTVGARPCASRQCRWIPGCDSAGELIDLRAFQDEVASASPVRRAAAAAATRRRSARRRGQRRSGVAGHRPEGADAPPTGPSAGCWPSAGAPAPRPWVTPRRAVRGDAERVAAILLSGWGSNFSPARRQARRAAGAHRAVTRTCRTRRPARAQDLRIPSLCYPHRLSRRARRTRPRSSPPRRRQTSGSACR